MGWRLCPDLSNHGVQLCPLIAHGQASATAAAFPRVYIIVFVGGHDFFFFCYNQLTSWWAAEASLFFRFFYIFKTNPVSSCNCAVGEEKQHILMN